MGTNFYWYKQPACSCCNRPFERLHIGKSSAGWCFSLHVIPEEGIDDLENWEKLWTIPGSYIEDEYGTKLTALEMKNRIVNRSWHKPKDQSFDYELNYAVPGPNNLVRHKLVYHCVKHGKGTWDCITGEFS